MQIKNLSFFKDSIYISPSAQKESISFQVLAFLERWLAIGSSRNFCNKYELNKHSYKCFTLSIFSEKKADMSAYALSTSKKITLFCLKILATVLVVPRLIAELTRLYLRKSLQNFLDFTPVAINNSLYNALEINSHIAKIHSELLTQNPINGVVYQQNCSQIIRYSPAPPHIISFELTQYPGLIFKIDNTTSSSSTKSSLSKEIDNMRTIQKHLKKQKTTQYFHLPLAYIYNEDSEDELFPCFIIEEKTEAQNLFTAHNLWQKYEIEATPVFIALAHLLISSGLPFSNPSNFILNVSKDNITMTIKADKDFLPLHHSTIENQLYFLFQHLYKKECMDAIINSIIKEKKLMPNKYIDSQLNKKLQEIKEERLQAITLKKTNKTTKK